MVTMPETAAHSIERMEPSPAEMVLRAWGDRFWTSYGTRRRLSLVSVNRSERNSKGAVVLREGEAGSARRGVPALEMALASSWLPGGMGAISDIGRGVRIWRGEVSRKQGGQV